MEIGIDIYTLICIKWITNKTLLYKKINKIKFKNSKEKEGKRTSLVAQWLRIHLPMLGDTGSSPGLGRFPHAAEQLSLCATTTNPTCHNS